MRPAIPGAARAVLERGILCHLAVRTSHGPHLTPVVFVLDGGRLWLTTSRSSVKRRAWRRDPMVGGLVVDGDVALTFRGIVRAYDALDPLSWPSAALRGPALVRAATRFSLKNARFFAGYAMDARRVPLAWTPPGRVFAAVRLQGGALLDLVRGTVTRRWGVWSRRGGTRATFAAARRQRGVDLRVPASVRQVALSATRGSLALDPADGVVVLPSRWRRIPAEGTVDAVLPRAFHDLAGAPAATKGALTLDQPSTWRAAEMRGILLQGEAVAYRPDDVARGVRKLRERIAAAVPSDDLRGSAEGHVLIRLRPQRVVWWEGWASGTVAGSR